MRLKLSTSSTEGISRARGQALGPRENGSGKRGQQARPALSGTHLRRRGSGPPRVSWTEAVRLPSPSSIVGAEGADAQGQPRVQLSDVPELWVHLPEEPIRDEVSMPFMRQDFTRGRGRREELARTFRGPTSSTRRSSVRSESTPERAIPCTTAGQFLKRA